MHNFNLLFEWFYLDISFWTITAKTHLQIHKNKRKENIKELQNEGKTIFTFQPIFNEKLIKICTSKKRKLRGLNTL